MNFNWPATPYNNLAPLHQMVRRLLFWVPFILLKYAIIIVVFCGWGSELVEHIRKELT